ncbi:MAG: TonB family protein [Janthinobacterium lividum]
MSKVIEQLAAQGRLRPAAQGLPTEGRYMTASPNFLQVLGLDERADEQAIRRAYARKIAQVDKRNDPATVQMLRAAYDAAGDWHRARMAPQMELALEPEAEPEAQSQPGAEGAPATRHGAADADIALASAAPAQVQANPLPYATAVNPSANAFQSQQVPQAQAAVVPVAQPAAVPAQATVPPGAKAATLHSASLTAAPLEHVRPSGSRPSHAHTGVVPHRASHLRKRLVVAAALGGALIVMARWLATGPATSSQTAPLPENAAAAMQAPVRLPSFDLMPMPVTQQAHRFTPTGTGLPLASTRVRRLAFLPAVKAPSPVYPAQALQKRQQGRVSIRAYVDEAGMVKEARVERSSGSASLDQAAESAVWESRYHPFLENGEAVPVSIMVRIRFRLPRN